MSRSLKSTIPDLKEIQSKMKAHNDHIISLTGDLFADEAHSLIHPWSDVLESIQVHYGTT